ncbi:MAG: HAD-IA family hydrolase [Clostridia bacterium]|nr:HAD-IA family hydrolase [Clostridia bacterium]
MIKNLIFDFDGTIVNSKDLVIHLYNELAYENNYKKLSSSDIEYLINLPISERIKLLDIPIHKIPSLLFEVLNKYRKHIHSLHTADGIVDLLYALKAKGFRLGIISSNAAGTIREFLKKNDMDMFENIYSAKNVFGKHYAINSFMKKYRLEKEETFYVGDEIRDIISCKKSGVPIIAVTWGYDSRELLSGGNPDFIADHPAEILRIACNLQIPDHT